MLQPMTDREMELTVKNILSACRDIRKLNKRGYNFLYLASGFIAHYNIFGFMDAYSEPGSLRRAILANRRANEWNNFSPADRDYTYYKAKAIVYDRLCRALVHNDAGQLCFAG